MTMHMRPPGGAAVGHLGDLGPVEAAAVMYFRLWHSGEAGRGEVARELGGWTEAFEAFVALCDLCGRHGRRPLMRHGPACACLGADEAWFATLIDFASKGAREDALMLACTMIRPDMAGMGVGMAEVFGLTLSRMSHTADRLMGGAPEGAVLH